MTSSCDFSHFSDEPCHKLTFGRSEKLLDFTTLDDETQKIYLWRASGYSEHHPFIKYICLHHYAWYGKRFEKVYEKCCNNVHRKADIFQRMVLQLPSWLS